MTKIILRNSLVLLAALFAEWWIRTLSWLPESIPHTNIRISGLILITAILTMLIINHRQLFKEDPQISIFKLTMAGSLICLLSEIAFQFARQFTMPGLTFGERLFYFGLGTIGVTLLATGPSFLVAFQVKTKNTLLLVVFIGVFTLLMSILFNRMGY